MFTPEEMRNVVALMKAGLKTMELDGNQMIVVGVLMRKCEEIMNPKSEVKPEDLKEVPKTEKPTDKKK